MKAPGDDSADRRKPPREAAEIRGGCMPEVDNRITDDDRERPDSTLLCDLSSSSVYL
jgi:hypothetical protein